jgi:hypothetical protein
MNGAIPPLPQYVFMARCSVKAQGRLYFLPIPENNNNNNNNNITLITDKTEIKQIK